MTPAEECRRIVDANAYVVLATVTPDGRPWATPVWFAHRDHREVVWVSRPGARHSENIGTGAPIGLVVFDSTVTPGEGRAVYAEADAGPVRAAELAEALTVYGDRSEQQGLRRWTEADVTEPAQHRLYRARVTALFVLDEHDRRVPVPL